MVIAAGTGEHRIVGEDVGRQLVVRRIGDHLRQGTAQHGMRRQVVAQVQRRQRIDVDLFRGDVGTGVRHARVGTADHVARTIGVGAHQAHAEVAAQLVLGEVQLGISRLGGLRYQEGVLIVERVVEVVEQVRRGQYPVVYRLAAGRLHMIHRAVQVVHVVQAGQLGQRAGADVGQRDRGACRIGAAHAGIDIELLPFVVDGVTGADQQLVDEAVEVLGEIHLAEQVARAVRLMGVVAEESALRLPVGRIFRRRRVVEVEAAVEIPAIAAGVGRFDEGLGNRVMRVAQAHLAVQLPAIAVVGAVQVDALRGDERAARLVVENGAGGSGAALGRRIVGIAGAGGVTTGDHAVAALGQAVDARLIVGILQHEGVHRLVQAVEMILHPHQAGAQFDIAGGLELDVGVDAVATLGLLEIGRVYFLRHQIGRPQRAAGDLLGDVGAARCNG